MRRGFLCAVSVLALMAPPVFGDYVSTVKEGNKAFQQKDYKKALECYRQAEPDLPVSPELDYNIGGALSGTGDYDEAIKKFQAALKSADPGVQAEAQYNLGNTYYRKKDFQNAISAYQEALKLNPADMDSKFNLELARKMLKEQIKPQQNDKQNKQDQKQQDQQNKQGQQKDQKDQKDSKDQKQNQDQQNQDKQNQQQKDQQQKQQQQGQAKKMSKEDAERILNALKDDEQDIQKKIRRENAKGDYVGKDW